MHCTTYSIPDLNPLDAHSTFPKLWQWTVSSDIAKHPFVFGGQKWFRLRIITLDGHYFHDSCTRHSHGFERLTPLSTLALYHVPDPLLLFWSNNILKEFQVHDFAVKTLKTLFSVHCTMYIVQWSCTMKWYGGNQGQAPFSLGLCSLNAPSLPLGMVHSLFKWGKKVTAVTFFLDNA